MRHDVAVRKDTDGMKGGETTSVFATAGSELFWRGGCGRSMVDKNDARWPPDVAVVDLDIVSSWEGWQHPDE
jgi:hypothetical protein